MLWEDLDEQFQDFRIVEPEFRSLLYLSRQTLRSFPENLQMELINLKFFSNLNCWLSDTKLQGCYFYLLKQFSRAWWHWLRMVAMFVNPSYVNSFFPFMNVDNKTNKTTNAYKHNIDVHFA